MDYKNLNLDTWEKLDSTGNHLKGYKSIWMSLNENEKSNLHIFKDEYGFFHLAIKSDKTEKEKIDNPKVNGLQINLNNYRFEDGEIYQFIDLKCNLYDYLEEFTGVVQEITKSILTTEEKPINVVNQVIRNWLSFWTLQRRQILSEENQIGLICELLVFKMLCNINPILALKSWTGPLGDINDFNFTNWNLEVKGTRSQNVIHVINGIEQLAKPVNKRLGFISFQVRESTSEKATNLPDIIDSIISEYFHKKPDLITIFNELLSGLGYSPIHKKEYMEFTIEIIKGCLFEVNEDFPKLTNDMLSKTLNNRVTSIRYEINLERLLGINLNQINWGNYFH